MPRAGGSTRTRASVPGGGGENTCFLLCENFEDDTSEANNNYAPVVGTWGAETLANEARVQQVISHGGTLRNLYVVVNTGPGAGKSWVVTVRVNGVNSLLTCTIADANTAAHNTAVEIAVNAGDLLSVEWAPNETPADPGCVRNSLEFVIT